MLISKAAASAGICSFFFFTTTGKPTVNGLTTLQIGAWQDGCVGFEKTQHVRLQGERTLKASSFHCEMRASELRITADNQEVKRRNRNQSEPWNFRVMDTDGRTFEQRSKITPSKKNTFSSILSSATYSFSLKAAFAFPDEPNR